MCGQQYQGTFYADSVESIFFNLTFNGGEIAGTTGITTGHAFSECLSCDGDAGGDDLHGEDARRGGVRGHVRCAEF
jgi:hypothetical protein